MSGTSVLVPTVVDDPMEFTVMATSPAEMEKAQHSLILWAARKIQAVKNEIVDAVEQLDLHKKNKWSPVGWQNLIRKHEGRAEFYRKIKAALEAGYYIVPPFPIDIFAIRVKKERPARLDCGNSDNHDQIAQILPVGEGRYVDPKPTRSNYVTSEDQKDGTSKQVRKWYADEYRDVDFPFKLARAEIREATDVALSLKIFDRVGVLPRTRKPDPVVCGQIIIPNQSSYLASQKWSRTDNREAITFFIAWWLDTKTL